VYSDATTINMDAQGAGKKKELQYIEEEQEKRRALG
jgi:hypothetical protein